MTLLQRGGGCEPSVNAHDSGGEGSGLVKGVWQGHLPPVTGHSCRAHTHSFPTLISLCSRVCGHKSCARRLTNKLPTTVTRTPTPAENAPSSPTNSEPFSIPNGKANLRGPPGVLTQCSSRFKGLVTKPLSVSGCCMYLGMFTLRTGHQQTPCALPESISAALTSRWSR